MKYLKVLMLTIIVCVPVSTAIGPEASDESVCVARIMQMQTIVDEYVRETYGWGSWLYFIELKGEEDDMLVFDVHHIDDYREADESLSFAAYLDRESMKVVREMGYQ